MALRYPADVRGLLLWRVTGGPCAAQRLVENYYTQFINSAQQGGMEGNVLPGSDAPERVVFHALDV